MGVLRTQGFGQDVTVISTSPNKEKEAREVLGADHFVVSKDEQQMAVRALFFLPTGSLCSPTGRIIIRVHVTLFFKP